MYKIKYSKDVEKDLSKLPKKEINKILKRIDVLAKNPRPVGVTTLKGNLKGLLRIRSGNYRIIYQILDDHLVIIVARIANRKSVYK